MTDDDLDVERMERRLRMKWGARAGKPAAPIFEDAEQKAMAEKLLGRDNIERLETRRPDAGRFRPTPVQVEYEYYLVKGDERSNYSSRAFDYWRINRVENGRQEEHWSGGSIEELRKEIAALAAKGHNCREARMGIETGCKNQPKPVSERKAILDRLGEFRIGERR